jgi:ABC-type phosphate/phosphonate transport system substrate-binding protein
MNAPIRSALTLAVILTAAGQAQAQAVRIAIMQAQAGDAEKYKPLVAYLAKGGLTATFVTAKDYPAAATMFTKGEVDAMFTGSGIAATLMVKDLADPIARPIGKDGHSTYWAVVIGPKGSPAAFTGKADFFQGKRVALTPLASSGEFYYRSLPGAGNATCTLLKTTSHAAALDAVMRGQADYAIIKNRVWDSTSAKFSPLAKLGEDKAGENPDGTLMVSRRADKALGPKLLSTLLALKVDASAEAAAVKAGLAITHFVPTGKNDFQHTVGLLRKAGVTKDFSWSF